LTLVQILGKPLEIGGDGKYYLKANDRTRLEGFMELLKTRRKTLIIE